MDGHSAMDQAAQKEALNKAQEFKHSGNEKFNNKNYKGAVAEYRKGLLHEPNNPDLHANLAATFIHLERFVDAEEHAVYAIHLRPTFHKGYMRAAKAAHGKCMTNLALKHLEEGLSKVTDINGLREINRLKTQYKAYLSLPRNKENEMDFDSDCYQSEEDDEPYSSDEEPEEEETPTPVVVAVEPVEAESIKKETVPAKLTEPIKPDVKTEEPPKNKTTPQTSANTKTETSANTKPEISANTKPETSANTKPETSANTKPEPKIPSVQRQKSTEKEVDRPPEKEPDRFLEMCKELSKDPELKKRLEDFKGQLHVGGEAYLAGNFRRAAECYRAAKDRVGLRFSDYEIDERQLQVIKYAHCAALISIGTYDELVRAIQTLADMKTFEFSMPAMYILMARAYYKLNRFKNALEPLDKAQEIIDNCPIFDTFTWPGTTETIQETTPVGIKDAIKELKQLCTMSHKATAVCRLDNCSRNSAHIIPSDQIYFSDPDFAGFVRMICEEKCHIEFHISCWKSYKEIISGVEKINDKEMLGRRCLTTDCVSYDGEPSIVTTIEIFGPDGEVKSTNKLDPKAATDSKNAKKKKIKERDDVKVPKPKKPKEKKVREEKKRLTLAVDGEETLADHVKDPKRALEARLESLAQLRSMNFGFDKTWNPRMPFYGQAEEAMKWSKETPSHLTNSQDPVEVRDAKEFIFSYFMPILKEQGPLKQSDVDGLWKESAGDFCDITVVLPNLKSISELLNESTCFCLLEDYICLAEQLDAAYDLVKTEVCEIISILMTGSLEPSSSAPQTNTNLPDLIRPQILNTASQSSSEEESEDSSDEESESEEEAEGEEVVSDEENKTPPISESPEPPQDSSGDVFETPYGDVDEDFVIPPSKPIDDNNFDDEKFSLQKMLDEIKNTLMKGSEETVASEHPDVSERVESPCDEGFSTPLNQSMSPPEDTNQTEEIVEEEVKIPVEKEETEQIDDQLNVFEAVLEIPDTEEFSGESLVTELPTYMKDSLTQDRDKASQSDVLLTEERQMQTTPLETKDRLSQTKDCDLHKDLLKKVEELTLKLGCLTKKNNALTKELEEETAAHKNTKTTFENTIQQLHEENRKNGKALQDNVKALKAEFDKKELAFKQKEENLQKTLRKKEETYLILQNEHLRLMKNMEGLTNDKEVIQKELITALQNVQQFESFIIQSEEQMKKKLQQTQKSQLATIKSFWESQINLLRKRCVEKISEMQSWFSMFPSEEVEDLPSWNLIKQNTIQWGEISKKMHAIEANFHKTYSSLENRIQGGEEVDLTQVLPVLPEEPTPLPLDKIHQEITAKHLKKIAELSSLVVSQQMEIEKSKEANQQIHQLVNSLQMGGGPRIQSPMTTAFGSLALQYSYPPQPLPVPTIPPNQDANKSGVAANFFQADVQTLLQESSKAVTFTGASEKAMNKSEEAAASGQRGPPVSFYKNLDSLKDLPPPNMPAPTTMPPPNLPSLNMPPLSMPPPINMPPPPMSVAQNRLKTTLPMAVLEKKDKPQPVRERSLTPVAKASSSSRESTPIPSTSATPSPTPEKVKKKKKKADAVVPAVSVEVKMNEAVQKEDDWNVVGKSAISKQAVSNSLGTVENKLKNKKKLLDKLHLKYPNSSLKDLDDIVKLVREQNNGSLTGLHFDEIETRVDRFITKRHFQKSSNPLAHVVQYGHARGTRGLAVHAYGRYCPLLKKYLTDPIERNTFNPYSATMGLDKFTAAAWAPVKQLENPTWSNLGLEECTICLDSMDSDQPRTRVDCNHEFHTQCLRQWLKEKRACPLCNKFTTMPDEFPAL